MSSEEDVWPDSNWGQEEERREQEARIEKLESRTMELQAQLVAIRESIHAMTEVAESFLRDDPDEPNPFKAVVTSGFKVEDLFGEMQDYQVMKHNTMRFDLQLAYVQPIFEECDGIKEKLIKSVTLAIAKAVNDTLGVELDGRPIPSPPHFQAVKSDLLHHEFINFDLS